MKTASLLFLLCASITAQTAHYTHDGRAVLPDPHVTPGASDPALTAAKLCNPAFHTGSVRAVSEKMKKQVCTEYGRARCPGPGFEIDHLESIEIGGAEAVANLWPQPVDSPGVVGFHTKDLVENRAHAAVCAGRITLKQAQQGLAGDWYKFGEAEGFVK